jgi:hypothetical protein
MFRTFMLRIRFRWRTALFIATMAGAILLINPCGLLAQRHGGGGSSSGGGGMNSIGRPTGVDQKDDLKDFHEALAVQATSQQIVDYNAMVKSTAAVGAATQELLEQLDKKNVSALADRGAALEQALEKARTENKNFLAEFSSPQKSGLKELTKKLTRADAELAQRSVELNQRIADAKPASDAIASSVQNLEGALANFQNEQASLGQEMGIVNSDGEDVAFEIAPVRNSISFKNQPVVIVTTGAISRSAAQAGPNSYAVKLTEDISDLQQNITQVLRAQLDKAERCGERVAIQNATIMPMPPTSLVSVQLHFERWSCFGGQNNEMAEGDGSLEVKLTPEVAADGTLRLRPVVGRIDAQGLLGESLRSGSLGDELRDKIAESILSTVRQGGNFKVILPPAAQNSAVLRHTQFQSTGAGALTVVLEGEIKVSDDKATALASELKERSALVPSTPQ